MNCCHIYPNRGWKTDWMDQYQTVEMWVVYKGYSLKFSDVCANSIKFYEFPTTGWPREVLHVVKKKKHHKWELNTCNIFVNRKTEDFFVGRCRIKIYTM